MFHKFIKDCGAEFVKIDNQSSMGILYKNMAPIGQTAREYHNAIESSVGKYFNNQMINCMGAANEDMWNRKASPISRCSCDFEPECKEWFNGHIVQCAYNCLFQGQFYYCDWDMWWTDDSQAVKNSLIRAISGGPIYVSDTLNRSIKKILEPLILSDGKILRCDRPAMPTMDCLTEDPTSSDKAFKIQNMSNDCGVMVAFNLNEENKCVAGYISPSEIVGLEGDEFAVYEHFLKDFYILKYNEKLDISLKNDDDFRLYIIVPLKNGTGIIGRTDKYISPATYIVENDEVKFLEEGPYAYVEDEKLYYK